jgi:hypothetical protein
MINSLKVVRELLILIVDQRADGLGGIFFNCLGETGEPTDPPWSATRVVLAHAIQHHLLNHKLLHFLGDGRNTFCSLTTLKMDHEKWATERRLGRLVLDDGEGNLW